MRRVLWAAAGAVMLIAASVSGFGESGFDGSWAATVPGPSGQGGLSVTFAFRSEDHPSGSVTVQGGRTFDLVNVKVSANTIAFQVEGEEQNLYSGQLSGDEIKMQVKYQSHENGTRVWSFVAKRAAQMTLAPDHIDGDWTGEVPRGGGQTIAATFSFHVESTALSGSVHALDDDYPIVDGSVNHNAISFSIGATKGKYTGVIDGDAIHLKVKYDGGENGRVTLPFDLKRVGQ